MRREEPMPPSRFVIPSGARVERRSSKPNDPLDVHDYIQNFVILSKRESRLRDERASKDPEDASCAMLHQGVLTKMFR